MEKNWVDEERRMKVTETVKEDRIKKKYKSKEEEKYAYNYISVRLNSSMRTKKVRWLNSG